MKPRKFIAYYRVSTQRQGVSGLGLDAQRTAVESYLNGGSWSLIAEYTEVESGKRSDRPQLAAAMAHCRLVGATLVIAKLDRLSRNVAFLAALMDGEVEFVSVDNPHATRFTVHILAAVAEHEREMISQRTRAALAAAQARGVRLGGWRSGPKVDWRRGVQALQTAADRHATMLEPTLSAMRAAGKSLRTIAAELQGQGVRTPRGGLWTATAVRRALMRTGHSTGPAPAQDDGVEAFQRAADRYVQQATVSTEAADQALERISPACHDAP